MIILLVFGLALISDLVRTTLQETFTTTLHLLNTSFATNLPLLLTILFVFVLISSISIFKTIPKLQTKEQIINKYDSFNQEIEAESKEVQHQPIPKQNAIIVLSQTIAIASILFFLGSLLYLVLVEPWDPDPATPYLARYDYLTSSQFSAMFIMCASIATFLVSTFAELFQKVFAKTCRATITQIEAWAVVFLICEICYVWWVAFRGVPIWWIAPQTTARDRTGLFWGLFWAGIGQVFVLAYHYARRELGFLRNPSFFPLIQPHRPPNYRSFFAQTLTHLVQPSAFALMVLYLCGTWIVSLMPESYYDYQKPTEWVHVLAQLLVVDFFTVVNHIAEHAIVIIYISSHKPHHRYVSPQLFDAFDGSTSDTSILILLPLFCTMRTLTFVNTWSYIAFGFAYSTHFMLIHSEWTHPGDRIASWLGIYTPSDHHVHHARFKYNYAHFFTYWDRILGTYKKDVIEKEVKEIS